MRAIWKGSITFGLVSIPISLYPATHHEELKFRLLRESDLSPINYKRVAQADGKEVPWDKIVKGYEYEKGKFVVLRDEDFKRVDIEATQTVDIMNFVELAQVNPMYFHRPYYMEVGKGGDRPYALLLEALRDSGKVGIAKVVIKTRQYLAAVKPLEKNLLLELMHFAQDIIEPEEFKTPAGRAASKEEKKMAQQLIQSMTVQWDPDQYNDDYQTALEKLIEKKIESGGKPIREKRAKKPAATKSSDLVAMLKKSLSERDASTKKKRSRVRVPQHG